MLRITLLGLLMKGIPEGLISGFGIFSLTKRKFDGKKFLYLSIFLVILTYLSRLLPTGYSVHILISIAIIVFTSILLLHIHVLQAIKAALIIITIILVNECITICTLNCMFGRDKMLQIIMNPLCGSIAGIPSTIVFGIIVFVIYVNYYKKNIA